MSIPVGTRPCVGHTGKSSLREGQANQLAGGWKEQGTEGTKYLGVEDVAGNSAEHEQPVFLHGPGDTQPGHPLQGALVSLIVVTQTFVLFFLELFYEHRREKGGPITTGLELSLWRGDGLYPASET